MRFLKQSQINFRNVKDHSVAVEYDSRITMDGNISLLIPKGTGDSAETEGTDLNQRPIAPVNGMIRYNEDSDEFEGYQNGAWRAFRFKEPTEITYQTIGTGDYVETYFGPLTPTSETHYANSDGIVVFGPDYGQNIMVFVENVFQIWTTNYVLEQDPLGFDPGWYINFTSAPPNKPITVIYGFDN